MGKSLIFSTEGARHKRSGSSRKTRTRRSKRNHLGQFVSGATKHKGSFTRYCEAHGHRGASRACIKRALKSGTPRRKHQAELTRRLKNTRSHRKK